MGFPYQSGIPVPDALFYIVAAGVAVEGIALILLARALRRHRTEDAPVPSALPPAAAKEPEAGGMEDVFLLHRSGLLLKHYTRRLRPNMDSDVLSGMLVAVQEFIKDSFRGQGGLDEIRFAGQMRIKVLEGKWTIIAALIRGETTAQHREQMKAALKDLETRYEDLLIDWDGTMDRIPEVDRIMMRLIDGGYGGPVPLAATG
jgi:hypothetical protein